MEEGAGEGNAKGADQVLSFKSLPILFWLWQRKKFLLEASHFLLTKIFRHVKLWMNWSKTDDVDLIQSIFFYPSERYYMVKTILCSVYSPTVKRYGLVFSATPTKVFEGLGQSIEIIAKVVAWLIEALSYYQPSYFLFLKKT